MGNGVVTAGGGVAGSTGAVPAERRGRGDLRVGDNSPAAVGGVVDSDRAGSTLVLAKALEDHTFGYETY